jgi:hypothetical protein
LFLGTSGGAAALVVVVTLSLAPVVLVPALSTEPASLVVAPDEDVAGCEVVELGDDPPHAARVKLVAITTSDVRGLIARSINRSDSAVRAGRAGETRHHASP